ncbi:hypothetical protein [Rhizobium sp. PP-CC-3G-465]|uniref:hypothetical protein n=1 Tax=Rhizobium sp. PP-CC-3G-465 TaxID=2135648 RepID=UPI0010537B35|nr:hypothetical protein C8J33_101873 [Rhizobium sp. PP-CC-3G-465]
MTRPVVTQEHVDVTQDALVLMRFLSQRLSVGEVTDDEASEMSWLLGTAKRRLEPVIELLENFEWHQVHGDAESLTNKTNRPRDARQEVKP